MKRWCRGVGLVALGLGMVAVNGGEAFARKQYDEAFKAAYVKEGTPLAAAVAEAKCNVCHVGKSKKDRNVYGQAIGGKLEKNTKDADAIRKALDAVAAMSSDPANPVAPTFGDLIAEGKLPGGAAN